MESDIKDKCKRKYRYDDDELCDRIEPPNLFCLSPLKLALCSDPDLARSKKLYGATLWINLNGNAGICACRVSSDNMGFRSCVDRYSL